MPKLTARQAEVLALIKSRVEDYGYPPTRAEIAQTLGFKSANAAEEHLRALSRKGVIEMIPGTSRGIRIKKACSTPISLPVIPQAITGGPLLAPQHLEGSLLVDFHLFSPKPDFLLRIQDTDLKNFGILQGDLLAVHITQEIHNGHIMVARFNNALTVKQVNREKSPHTTSKSSAQTLREFSIEGLSVGIIRPSVSYQRINISLA